MVLSGGWCTIESDPGVFTNLVESFGVIRANFADLWYSDKGYIQYLVYNYRDIYGLVFLFKWQASADDNISDKNNVGGTNNDRWGGGGSGGEPLIGEDVPPGLLFARQMTHNACAIQAMLSILLNLEGAVEGDKAGETKAREIGITANGATAAKNPPSSRLFLGKTLADL